MIREVQNDINYYHIFMTWIEYILRSCYTGKSLIFVTQHCFKNLAKLALKVTLARSTPESKRNLYLRKINVILFVGYI